MPPSDDSSQLLAPTLRQAFEALIPVLEARRISYAIIGGMATIQHTRTRTTNDIDALLTIPQISMPGFFEALREAGFTVDLLTNIRELRDDALTSVRFRQVVVDLLSPSLPAFSHVLDRAVVASIFGKPVRISAAEGLIVMKLIANRPLDQADVEDLLDVYGEKLDFDFIRSELDSILEQTDPRWVKFEERVEALRRDP